MIYISIHFIENRRTRLKFGSWHSNVRLWPHARLQTALERCQDINRLNAWWVDHPQGPITADEQEELNDLILQATASHMLCQYAHGQPIMDETLDQLDGQIPNWKV